MNRRASLCKKKKRYRGNEDSVCIRQQNIVASIESLGSNAQADVHDVDEETRCVVRCMRGKGKLGVLARPYGSTCER